MSPPSAPAATAHRPGRSDRHNSPGGPDQPGEAADQRGVTTITDAAIERIAARAVAEVDLATGTPRQILGVLLGGTRVHTPARVDAAVIDGVIRVRIALSVHWPAPVRRVTGQVRAHVTDRLATLTGLDVGWVDIDVPTLFTGAGSGRVS